MHPNLTPRQQFVRLCDCGCGEPTLVERISDPKRNRVPGRPLRFLKGHQCRGVWNYRWKGRYHLATGYIVVRVADHPYGGKKGEVFEHRLVMESVLGRYLTPDEIVHHKDGNKANNAPENLQVMSNAEHTRLHRVRTKWSANHDCCSACGTTARPHKAHGCCGRCHRRLLYQKRRA